MIWDLPSGSCDWIAIWDTGKTFDMNGHKIAAIWSNSAVLTRRVDQALHIIQFAPSRLSLVIFRDLLIDDRLAAYISCLGNACRKNLAELRSCLPEGGVIIPPIGGTLAWIDLSASLLSGDELCQEWLARGVGAVSGRVFFAGYGSPNAFMRVSLARLESYFEEALSLVRRDGHG
jgi:DNA-binding transcriptional MocR family regulator